MKTPSLTSLCAVGVLVAAGSAQAQFTVNNGNSPISAFSGYAIGGTGALAFSDTQSSPSGLTIAGGSAVNTSGGNAMGETFLWSGATATLDAFAFVSTGEGGNQTYQPFLFDLGSSTHGGSATGFIPGNQVNLLATGNITDPALNSGLTQLEIDIAGGVTLVSGQSYAVGSQNTSGTFDLNLQKSSGGQSDVNGEGFTFSGGLSSANADNPSPFSGSPRNLFLGLYTTAAVPEPCTMALFGLGAMALTSLRRAANSLS
jgi:hypothetical protein